MLAALVIVPCLESQSLGQSYGRTAAPTPSAPPDLMGAMLVYDESASVALLDLRMPGLDGFGVLRQITARRLPHPVVIITGHGDVPVAVAAMKAGACDFVEKPFAGETILRAADAAMRRGDAALAEANEAAEAAARLAALSPREADVLRGVVSGRQNKVIARLLGISPRTVEIHRGNVMSKLGVRSVPEVMRLALAGGFTSTTSD